MATLLELEARIQARDQLLIQLFGHILGDDMARTLTVAFKDMDEELHKELQKPLTGSGD
jgi:hypothetical protein